ncbi:MAG: hypothetical protein HGB12_17140, partial [Bacteroidetes bacterium]|nr:hypothetical protein [Bacteroidota bacterium]
MNKIIQYILVLNRFVKAKMIRTSYTDLSRLVGDRNKIIYFCKCVPYRYKQLSNLIIADFKEIIREPGVLFWGIIFPILMSVGLGIAFTQKADTVRKVAVIEKNASNILLSDSSSLINNFLLKKTLIIKSSGEMPAGNKFTIKNDKLGNTTFIFYNTSWDKAMVLLKQGYISIVLDEKNNHILYHFDPTNPDAKLS